MKILLYIVLMKEKLRQNDQVHIMKMGLSGRNFRHEYKYLCTEGQIEILRVRLNSIMKKDIYAGVPGKYDVKSLYYDDMDDNCFWENENGTDFRGKYRIRIYNNSKSYIALEYKYKERGWTRKESCQLTEKQFLYFVYGTGEINIDELPELGRKFFLLKQEYHMYPKVIVGYERTPYVYPGGNVRVTFDRGIFSSRAFESFFQRDLARRLILPIGWHLLEVKFDEYLPDFLYQALNISDMHNITFSKYYMCRKYHM